MGTTSLIQPRPSPKMDVIFDALHEGWPSSARNLAFASQYIVWGLIGNNSHIIKKEKAIFTDMPYFNRWLPGQDLTTSNWRFCANGVHENTRLNVTIDRFESFGKKVAPWQTETEHILICPSSDTMTMHMHGISADEWAASVKKMVTAYTNRPIRIRHKPRKNGTSGPAAADVSIEDDLVGCHAVITSGSLTVVDALLAGVPVFTTSKDHCPAAWCSNTDFTKINNPILFDREHLLANLAWKQYSIEEMRSGFCYENFRRLHHHQGW